MFQKQRLCLYTKYFMINAKSIKVLRKETEMIYTTTLKEFYKNIEHKSQKLIDTLLLKLMSSSCLL